MALCISKRRLIVQEKLSGKSLLSISSTEGISYATTKRVWQRYKARGATGLGADYANCGPKRPKYYRIYRFSIMLKRKYPKWGAPVIRDVLSKRYPEEKMPSIRTIQLWFKQLQLNKPIAKRPNTTAPIVEKVHDCWQIDAKENITLTNESDNCYLTTVDVKSGIALEVPVFPPQED